MIKINNNKLCWDFGEEKDEEEEKEGEEKKPI